jgi:O-antigen ligase
VSVVALTHEGFRQRRHTRQVWWVGYLVIVGGGLMVAALARRRVTEPWLGLSLALILLLLLGWLIRPRATLYATLFLTAVSDIVTVWWFPFVKNLSSRESISFVSDALTVSPLELSLYLGFGISTMRLFANTKKILPRTELTWPLVAFSGFVVFGFFNGVMSGGNLRAAVLEGRALLYILLAFVIIVNECTERKHLHAAIWAVLAGVVLQAVLSIQYLGNLTPSERDALEALNEHGASIGQDLLIVVLVSLMLFRVKAPIVKWALVLGAIPTLIVFFVSQRRAGVAALIVGGAIVAISLYWRRRRAFWKVVPIVAVVLLGYVGAFWNSQSSFAFPAQAIKTIVAPDQASAADQSSDLYRVSEAFDLNFTIRTDPLRGLGFGHAFYRPIPLPDISVFEMNAYLPHNSVLWIWVKTGFGGFVAMFYLFAKSIMAGADRVRRTAEGVDLAATVSAVALVVMYAVYSFVDVSWDARNTVFLALALAICTDRRRDPAPQPPEPDRDETTIERYEQRRMTPV